MGEPIVTATCLVSAGVITAITKSWKQRIIGLLLFVAGLNEAGSWALPLAFIFGTVLITYIILSATGITSSENAEKATTP